jgi:hypothetical protein
MLDLPYELELNENRDYAELIYDELIERGINVQYDENLSDSAFRKVITARISMSNEMPKNDPKQ